MNGISRDDMMELVALYALGVLPREEAALVAAFLANDDAARAEYVELRASADALAYSAEEPVDSARSARMKERLLARVRNEPSNGTIARRRIGPNAGWLWAASLATAASLLLAIISTVQVFSLQGQLARIDDVVTAIKTEVPDADVRAEGPELMFASELDEAPLHAIFSNVHRTPLGEGTRKTIAFYRRTAG